MNVIHFIAITVLLSSATAIAAPEATSISGRILKSDGTPFVASSVQFALSVTDPTGNCSIYEESSTVNMNSSNGNFEFSLGLGSRTFPANGTTLLLSSVFDNTTVFTCNGSAPPTYTPAVSDNRLVKIQFFDGTAWKVFSPSITLNSVPRAFYASSAAKLGTNSATDFVLKTGLPVCTPNTTFLSWDGTALSCQPVSGTAGGTVTSITAGTGLTGGTITSSGPIAVNVGTGASQIVQLDATAKLPIVDGSNLTNLNATNLTSGTLPIARLPALTGDVTSSAGSSSITLNTVPLTKGGTGLSAGGTSNQILGMNAAGIATEYKTLTQGAGVTISHSTNSITISATGGGTVTSVAGTLPISVATGTTTPIVSIATANASTTGAISSTDWNTFNTKLSTVSGTSLSNGFVWVGNATSLAAARTLNISDTKSTVAGNFFTASGACTSGQHLEYSSVNDNVSCQAYTLTPGQVTSALSGASFFAAPGSVTAPSFSFSGNSNTGFFNASSNNTISVTAGGTKIFDFTSSGLGSPTSGGASVSTAFGTAAAPTYSFTGDTGTGLWRPITSTIAASTAGIERLRIDGSGNVGIGTTAPAQLLHVSQNINAASMVLNQNGNTSSNASSEFRTQSDNGNSGSLGITSSTYSAGGMLTSDTVFLKSTSSGGLNLATTYSGAPIRFFTGSGTPFERLRIDTSGNVGIGVTTPSAKLDVSGHIANSGASATIGTCGSSPSLIGNDTKGSVTIGIGSITSCQINFNLAFSSVPDCVVTWKGATAQTAVITANPTASQLTVLFSISVPSGSFSYHCLQ